MFVSFVKAVDRKSGKVKTLAEVVTLTHDQNAVGKVRSAWRDLHAASEKGSALRAQFSNAICFLGNAVHGKSFFRDKNTEAEKAKAEARKQELLERQRSARQAAEEAKAAFETAMANAKAFGVAVADAGLEAKLKELELERDDLAKQLAELQAYGDQLKTEVDSAAADDSPEGDESANAGQPDQSAVPAKSSSLVPRAAKPSETGAPPP